MDGLDRISHYLMSISHLNCTTQLSRLFLDVLSVLNHSCRHITRHCQQGMVVVTYFESQKVSNLALVDESRIAFGTKNVDIHVQNFKFMLITW